MRSRRSLRSMRSCLSARTLPSLRVRRASTPWRIHTSSCASFLSNSAACFASTSSAARFCTHVVVVAARPRAQLPAIEFDDARRQAAHESAIVADEQQRAGEIQHHVFEPGDGLDVQMIGRLIQQQKIRRGHQRAAEHHAPPPAARQVAHRGIAVELQPRDHLIGLQLGLPIVVVPAGRSRSSPPRAPMASLAARHLLRQARDA